jgi:hypothetical protein
MKLLILAFLALTLTACGNQNIKIEETRIVVMPPASLFDCPDTPAPPVISVDTTQAEVADYVLKLYQNEQVCKKALDDVKAYLEQAKNITNDVEN